MSTTANFQRDVLKTEDQAMNNKSKIKIFTLWK